MGAAYESLPIPLALWDAFTGLPTQYYWDSAAAVAAAGGPDHTPDHGHAHGHGGFEEAFYNAHYHGEVGETDQWNRYAAFERV